MSWNLRNCRYRIESGNGWFLYHWPRFIWSRLQMPFLGWRSPVCFRRFPLNFRNMRFLIFNLHWIHFLHLFYKSCFDAHSVCRFELGFFPRRGYARDYEVRPRLSWIPGIAATVIEILQNVFNRSFWHLVSGGCYSFALISLDINPWIDQTFTQDRVLRFRFLFFHVFAGSRSLILTGE